ncbi:MAG: hypothetical protein LCH30_11075 [Proteobacteria bacterium]|nr:hypothetical protein [Pseudomonadota bacterium]
MKKIIGLCSVLLFNLSFAANPVVIPDEFMIKEHWISLTTSYDIETKTEKLGTLYRKFFSLLLTYEFYDVYENKLAIAKSRFFSLTAHFDIYDLEQKLLGMADEKFLAFFPTFNIYSANGEKQVSASLNFWGTTFKIYDTLTNQEIASMHRPFFRLKNDWEIKITDKDSFMRKGIDSRVLMTVLAFQGDREYWKKQKDLSHNKALLAKLVTKKEILNKIEIARTNIVIKEGMNTSDINYEALMEELELNFNNLFNFDLNQTDEEKLEQFIDYCLGLISTPSLSVEKKQAILYLLKTRLKTML